MKISLIIPNYNGKKLLKKNFPQVLEVIKEYKNGRIDIIVVDDCSTDNSVKYIRSQIENPREKLFIRLLQNKKNLGFSSTVNRGMEKAKGEIVILLNTDVVPEKDFLGPLLKHFEDPETFAVGCLDKSIEKGKTILRGRGVGKFKKGFLIHERGKIDETDTLWVSGGSGAFRRSIWKKLGGFDKLYKPFYWEDIDLSYRALKSGYKIFFEPKSRVSHYHGEGVIKRHYSKSYIKIIAYRNQFIFTWKNITDLDLQFSHLLWLPYHFLKAILRGDFYFLLGFFLALAKLPFIIRESFKAQQLFIKPDREVLSQYD